MARDNIDETYEAIKRVWGDPPIIREPSVSSDDLAIPALAETIYTGYMTKLTHGKSMFLAWISLPQEYKALWTAAAKAAYYWKALHGAR